jgi:uncharacterized protein YbbK (DUF523 family)
MKKIALSACLLGCSCRYDAKHNLNDNLLELLSNYELVSFCPEDYCFGTPRPTMDLIQNGNNISVISNKNKKNLSSPIQIYAQDFFSEHPEIELFIGKDRSPSCAVKSAKVYDVKKNLLHREGTGLMAEEAISLGISCWDAEVYVLNHTF